MNHLNVVFKVGGYTKYFVFIITIYTLALSMRFIHPGGFSLTNINWANFTRDEYKLLLQAGKISALRFGANNGKLSLRSTSPLIVSGNYPALSPIHKTENVSKPDIQLHKRDMDISKEACQAQGDPAVFGNNQWNVYAYNSGNGTIAGTDWSTDYRGYYTTSSLNLNTENDWAYLTSPSAAANYQGCPVNVDLMSYAAKRIGFPCGFYTIDVPLHDDAAQLFVNGIKVWEDNGCCVPKTGIWSGWLGANDSLEFRISEGGGGSAGHLTFNLVTTNMWYLDADNDGYYTGSAVPSCSSPGTGYTTIVSGGGDCNDNNSAINPGAIEVCNGRDDDCDGLIDDGTSISPIVIANGPLTFCNSSTTTLTASLGNNALQLNGVNQYIITPSLTPVFASKNSFTIELWFKANSGGVLVTELGQNAVNVGFHCSAIEILSNGTVLVRPWNMPSVTLGTITFGSWNHVVMRYNATTQFLDGALNGIISGTGSVGNRLSPMFFGLNQYWAFGAGSTTNMGNGNFFNGTIDEVRIWDTAITNVQIGANYNKTVSGNARGLVAYYKLDETAGVTATDAGSNGFNAAIVNNPVSQIPADNHLNNPGYLWSVINATTPTITTNTGGAYNVQVSVSANCTATSGNTVLNVSDSIIYVNAAAGAGGNGTSWATAYNNLQTALIDAAANSCTKQIWVAGGTYKPTTGTDRFATFAMLPGIFVYGSFAGNETNLNQRTAAVMAANPSVLSGDLLGNDLITGSGAALNITNNNENSVFVVLNVSNGLTTTNSLLDGFIVTGGNNGGGLGAGMFNSNSSPKIRNVLFVGNQARDGGGIANASSSPVLENVVFLRNRSTLTGGGMHNISGSNPILENVTFSGNLAERGGGMFFSFASSTLKNVIFSGNYASGASGLGGGGIHSFGSSLILENATFSANSAMGDGGGIYVSGSSSSVSIKNSIFRGNTNLIGIGPDIRTLGTTANISYSLLQLPQSNYAFGYTLGAGMLYNQDPLFVNPADPDGADNILGTADDGLSLQQCSRLVNAGDNTGVATTDLTGNPRIVGGSVDMGAYENPAGASILAQLTADPSVIPAFPAANTYSASQKVKLFFSPAGGILSVLSGPGVIGTGDTLSFTGSGTVQLQYNSTNCGNPNSTQISLQATVGTLPVRLLEFNAVMRNCTIMLSWQTGFEQNTDRFEIEKGTNGTNWQYAGYVTALNNMQGGAYSFSVLPHVEPVMFYRLKMVDKDGTFTYSNVVTVQNSCAGSQASILVMPNPVRRESNAVTVIIHGRYRGRARLTLFNRLGQKLITKEINVTGSSMTEQIDIPQGINGHYLLQFTDMKGNPLCPSAKVVRG